MLADREFDPDYGSFRMSRMTVGLLLVGVSRLAYLDPLRLDPLFHCFAGLKRLPSGRTFSRCLKLLSRATHEGSVICFAISLSRCGCEAPCLE
ncbi:MAG: hypothetical protein CL908_16525 [Deltaproteobacteria bacterium]|nr:hypothetical protein [Deltaproteobacteria bacterium]